MQITRVELDNIKSYNNAVIPFAAGTNAICGENGAGKTSIVEAIGFALFDVMPYKKEQFVREGSKTGTVTVTFVSSSDERTYQVVRKTGGSSQYFVYDPEIKSKLVEGKEDVQDWLAEQLGVESAQELTGLFSNAVGVAQGTLTAPFLQRGPERKPMFDRLLRVEDYEKAWLKLRDTQGYIKDELADRRESAAGMRAEVKNLPKATLDAGKYEEQADKGQSELDTVSADLERVTAEKQKYDALEKQLDRLGSKIETLTERAESLQDQIRETEKSVAAARESQKIVDANESWYRQYEDAVDQLNELEAQRRERDRLVQSVNQLRNQEADVKARLEGVEEQLEQIAQAELAMSTLEPEVKAQEQVDEQILGAQNRVERYKENRSHLSEEKETLKELESEFKEITKGLEKRTRLEMQREETKGQLEEIETRLSLLDVESGQLEAEHERLNQMAVLLQQSDTSQCPVCRQDLTSQHRRHVLGETQDQLKDIRSRANGLRVRIKDAKSEQKTHKGVVVRLDGEIAELPRQADQKAAEKKIERQKNKVIERDAKVEEFASAADELKELRQRLKALGNPRERHAQAQGIASGRTKTMRELKKLLEQMEGIEKQTKSAERELLPYSSLDKEWGETKARRDTAKKGHEQYSSHAPIAKLLTQHEMRLGKLQEQLGKAQTDMEELDRERAEISRQYDQRGHQRIITKYDELLGEKQTVAERLRQVKERLKETTTEVKRLQKTELELRQVEKQIQELDRVSDLVEYLRKLIRSAGPQVTRMLVDAVSQRAARLYADILNDATMRLAWENDYEITVDVSGRARSFAQLSGGEQMAAALSVRLALLRQVSAIDIAFFDEPTANLDEIRRDNLADQITNVRGFSQLFVISHDDTFERATNNLIRVRKVNGTSQVESM